MWLYKLQLEMVPRALPWGSDIWGVSKEWADRISGTFLWVRSATGGREIVVWTLEWLCLSGCV